MFAAGGFMERASKNGSARHLEGRARLQAFAAESISPSDAASHASRLGNGCRKKDSELSDIRASSRRLLRDFLYFGSGQFRCLCKNLKVPVPLIVCGPL